jgi:hypothetical protein
MPIVTTTLAGQDASEDPVLVAEGYAVTFEFVRDDPAGATSFTFRPLSEDSIADSRQYLGYSTPITVSFAPGETGPKTVTLNAAEDDAPVAPPWMVWGLEAVEGVDEFVGPATGYGAPEFFPIAVSNDDGGPDADLIEGGDRDDVFSGQGGNDVISGHGGTDTALYRGPRADFTVTREGTTGQIEDGVAGRDGIDSLDGIERLEFMDGTLALDADGPAGQAYRLYQAAFARDPDVGGLRHQVQALDEGLGLLAISSNFLDSSEFTGRYGTSPSDAEFVTLLYRNVLAREPEEAGFQAHTAGLGNGLTREQLLVNFSDSAENRQQTAAEISGGIWLG